MHEIQITPEYVQSLGAGIRRMIINSLTPKERLGGLAPKERLEGLAPKERLAGLPPETVLTQFSPEELLARMDPAVIASYLRQRATQNLEQPPQTGARQAPSKAKQSKSPKRVAKIKNTQ